MTTSTPAFREKFLHVLRKHVRFVGADEPIPPDQSLVSIGLDSIGTINLLLDLELAFSVSFPGALLTPETFRTPATLEQTVASLVSAHD